MYCSNHSIGYANTSSILTTRKISFGIGERTKSDFNKKNDQPDPGSYNLHSDFDFQKNYRKGANLNTAGREAFLKVVAPDLKPQTRADEHEMPGPGTYDLKDGVGRFGNGNGRQCTIKAKLNYDHEFKRDTSPGPCAY